VSYGSNLTITDRSVFDTRDWHLPPAVEVMNTSSAPLISFRFISVAVTESPISEQRSKTGWRVMPGNTPKAGVVNARFFTINTLEPGPSDDVDEHRDFARVAQLPNLLEIALGFLRQEVANFQKHPVPWGRASGDRHGILAGAVRLRSIRWSIRATSSRAPLRSGNRFILNCWPQLRDDHLTAQKPYVAKGRERQPTLTENAKSIP
jgi:hypothetical protein